MIEIKKKNKGYHDIHNSYRMSLNQDFSPKLYIGQQKVEPEVEVKAKNLYKKGIGPSVRNYYRSFKHVRIVQLISRLFQINSKLTTTESVCLYVVDIFT